MKRDRYGNEVTTTSQAANEAYCEGVDLFLAAQDGAEDAFNRAIEADPNFSLAYAALARSRQTLAQMEGAVGAMTRAKEVNTGLSPRERSHLSILDNLIAGNGSRARVEIFEHIKSYPRDVLAVQPCCGVFGLIGFSGRSGREAEHLAFVASLKADYDGDWWFETQLAFAQCEVGQLESARKTIERAYAANPSNAHAAHYFSHVYYECGEGGSGLAFVEAWLRNYSRTALLHCHLSWHAALWQLEAGSTERAWRIIDEDVRPIAAWGPPINVLTDMASFLLRAEYAGEPRRDELWLEVSRYASACFCEPGVSFADAHAAVAHAFAGDTEALRKLREDPAGPAGDQVMVLANVFGAFVRSEWLEVVEGLVPIMSNHERLGGSRAQRDLLEFTLVNALLRLGHMDEATRMLNMRRPYVATTRMMPTSS